MPSGEYSNNSSIVKKLISKNNSSLNSANYTPIESIMESGDYTQY